ncbi:hypothetical protein [Mucilaginibacter sp.]|uniref:hypothetical protein n=1 Tax=Mucilaginibacter sp. TaxID=1882438 RepID=UPI003D14FF7B
MQILLALLLFLLPVSGNKQAKPQSSVKINVFKNVPDDLTGCGDDYYLSNADKSKQQLICRTDYVTALIYINNQPVRFKAQQKSITKNETIYTSGKYMLTVKKLLEKQLDSEYFIMKGIITLKAGDKIIFTQKIIGEGGC